MRLPWCAALMIVAACNHPKEAETEPGTVGVAATPESTTAIRGPDGTYDWHPITCSESSECYLRGGLTCPSGFVVYDRDKSASYGIIPIDHGQLIVKCAFPVANDQKLLDQLKAFCDHGEAEACKAHDFAIRKRDCCMLHQGARKCVDRTVVCFDGTPAEQCSC